MVPKRAGAMKIYDRVEELAVIETMHTWAAQAGRMTVITGRHRVGKTMLTLFAVGRRFLYLFVN